MKNKKTEGSVSKRFILYIMIVLVAVVLASSLAVMDDGTSGKNIMRTGTLILDLKEDNNLTLLNSVPTGDSEALESKETYDFTVENTGTETAKYRIYILEDTEKYQSDNCSDKKMPWSSLRYAIDKNETKGEASDLPDDGVILSTLLESGEKDKYKLRVWINSNAGNEVSGLHFHAKLEIKAILEDRTDYDTGA